MGIEGAVFDAGPLIHLNQIDRLDLLDVVETGYVPQPVVEEVGQSTVQKTELQIEPLEPSEKDRSRYLASKYGMDLVEATAVAFCIHRNVPLVFTDDLEARRVAKAVGLRPHGTLAIVTRAFREGNIGRGEAKQAVDELYEDSSLFITLDLVKWAKDEIEEHV